MYKNGIYGAILGDICGSKLEIYEMNNRHSQPNLVKRLKFLNDDYRLLQDDMFYTDDSILTIAICDALLHDKNYAKYIKEYGLSEINSTKEGERRKFGKMFVEWCNGSNFNSSYGNGCAMRISPIGYNCSSLNELESEVLKATTPTHNYPDSIKCALATAKAIFLAKNKCSKEQIKKVIEETLGLKLNYKIDDLRKNYTFTSKAIASVPQALFCFLESNSLENNIRLTLSVGGDADTTAAISTSVAAAYYGIDDELVEKINNYLPKNYVEVLSEANKLFEKLNEKEGIDATL